MDNSMKEIKEQLKSLEMSEDFIKLDVKNNKFNMFNVLKLENYEIRHSNFLAWLLNPNGSHLMCDNFFKEVLKMIINNHLIIQNFNMSISDVELGDFTDTEVTLEKMIDGSRRIDILLESKKNKFVCVIENKIKSDEWGNQLEDYYNYINSHEQYKNYKYKLFIFLTPKIENDCKQYKNYVCLSYQKVCQIIEALLKNIIKDDVKYFIENYKEMVEKDIMGKYDNEILELCMKLYKSYGNTIDLILQQGNQKACVLSVLEEVLNERKDLVAIKRDKHGFLFLPNNINNKEIFDNDNHSIVNLNCWGYAWNCNGLYIEVLVNSGKSDFKVGSEKRNNLIKYIENKMNENNNIKDKIRFIREDEEFTPSRELYKILEPNDYLNCENREEIKEIIQINLENSGYINALREALNSWKF